MKTSISLFIILFLFLGCTKQKTTPLNRLILTEHGISGINDTTSYNSSTIKPKLLSYDISIYNMFKDQATHPIMRVSYENQEIMLITPSHKTKDNKINVQSIIITSKYVKNPLNLDIGAPLNRNLFMTCHKNDKDNKELLCKQTQKSNLSWVFKQSNNTYNLLEIIWAKNCADL